MDHHPIHLHGFQFHTVATDGGPVPVTARVPQTTVLVPVGTTQTIEFVADEAGDWVMHCHMTHHMMNQMGHGFTNTLGMDVGDVDARIRKLLPGYMTMGQHGMAEMGEMNMAAPRNSIPMRGAHAQFGYTDMGGMFTILKVREQVTNYDEDPGWYAHPPGTVAGPASAEELAMLGQPVPQRKPPATTQAARYTCPMHEEIVQPGPGTCPKCKMDLEVRK